MEMPSPRSRIEHFEHKKTEFPFAAILSTISGNCLTQPPQGPRGSIESSYQGFQPEASSGPGIQGLRGPDQAISTCLTDYPFGDGRL